MRNIEFGSLEVGNERKFSKGIILKDM